MVLILRMFRLCILQLSHVAYIYIHCTLTTLSNNAQMYSCKYAHIFM